jgi:FkbM family methyltransferase
MNLAKRFRRAKRRLKKRLRKDPNRFLRDAKGVIHVGANVGQERHLYERHGLSVLWIEPMPDVFRTLHANLEGFGRQRALECLVTDRDDGEYEFHIANNSGSSSILDLEHHKDIWPGVEITRTITLPGMTLASLLTAQGIDPAAYDALIMDTQGSELLVLKGAEPVLPNFRYIKTEVADFEAYVGCCQVKDIEAFLTPRGYTEISRHRFAGRPGVGHYYDIVYERSAGPA